MAGGSGVDLDGTRALVTGGTSGLGLGATETGMLPPGDRPAGLILIDPAVMGPPIVWLASPQARDVHDERIVATDFDAWLARRA
jgi:hypothetical protein